MSRLSVGLASKDDRQSVHQTKMTSKGLVVFPAVSPGGGAINHLAWWIVTPKWNYFVSAEIGAHRLSDHCPAGLPRYLRRQPKKSGEVLDVRDGAVVMSPPDMDAVPTDASLGLFEGFLLGLFNWRSWDNHGSDDIAIIDYPGANAAWSSDDNRVRFGRNFTTSSQVIGHEFTHGVVQATASLKFCWRSRALNKSFADVIGKLAFPGSPPTGSYAEMTARSFVTWRIPWWKVLAAQTTFRSITSAYIPTLELEITVPFLLVTAVLPMAAQASGENSRPSFGGGTDAAPASMGNIPRLQPRVPETVRELASMGTAGVAAPASGAAAGGPMPVFDLAAVAQVDWALDKVELSPALQSGWFSIPGIFSRDRHVLPGRVGPRQ